MEYSPNAKCLQSPLDALNPITRQVWAAIRGALGTRWVVGTVRVETTFLWMSDSNSGSIGRSNRMAISSILLTNDLVNRSVV